LGDFSNAEFVTQVDTQVRRKIMFKHMAVFAIAVTFAVGVLALNAKAPASLAGSWMVDTRHSDAQLITDGTTDYGKTKIDVTLGFARVMGAVKIDDSDPAKSSVDLHIYPAMSMTEPIDEEGKFKSRWMANRANQTMLCFHSKNVARTAGGRLQTTGDLILVRVDRNVQVPAPSEAYSGPIYGPPITNRVSHEATLVFDLPASGSVQKGGGIQASASTKVFREDFPQLVKAVLSTNWPPLVQDENCRVPAPSEAYSGANCTGKFLRAPSLPEDPGMHIGEDYPGAQNFNAQIGERLDLVIHMHLTPSAGQSMTGGY
jgi:polyisoprenoid-binding protein YceI